MVPTSVSPMAETAGAMKADLGTLAILNVASAKQSMKLATAMKVDLEVPANHFVAPLRLLLEVGVRVPVYHLTVQMKQSTTTWTILISTTVILKLNLILMVNRLLLPLMRRAF